MTYRFRNYILFGLVGLGAALLLFFLLAATTEWVWFINWLIAINAVAFVFYGIDKTLSKTKATRIPEAILHLASLAGGFFGALLGMLVFRHKSNFREHPLFIPIMVISASLWGFLAYWFFWR
jgi:uncharacterized membrane protein YsdA (DUF1294 family)